MGDICWPTTDPAEPRTEETGILLFDQQGPPKMVANKLKMPGWKAAENSHLDKLLLFFFFCWSKSATKVCLVQFGVMAIKNVGVATVVECSWLTQCLSQCLYDDETTLQSHNDKHPEAAPLLCLLHRFS